MCDLCQFYGSRQSLGTYCCTWDEEEDFSGSTGLPLSDSSLPIIWESLVKALLITLSPCPSSMPSLSKAASAWEEGRAGGTEGGTDAHMLGLLQVQVHVQHVQHVLAGTL